jgi:phenylalanyl-tRNA synthetase beta chain
LVDYLGDVVLDLEVTPNRPDELSVIGIAREVAALTGHQVHLPAVSYPEAGPPAEQLITIDIPDTDLCSRYSATIVEGVSVGPSPEWMQERLIAAGMRPINNIVDITNYVMLEYGQPLHAFDYEKIVGRQIIVRRARPGEKLESLDGVLRDLDPEMLVIADAKRAVAIAGIMGGAESEVSEETKTVLLEAANFNPRSIRRTAARLRMRTEASLRFDKGISPELTVLAAKRATQLFLELAGGLAAAGVADAYPVPAQRPHIAVSLHELHRILGVDWGIDTMVNALRALEFDVEPISMADGEGVIATPPYYRTDIHLIEDVVEEVARIVGYDAVPTTLLSGQLPPEITDPLRELETKVRDVLVGTGMQEVINYPLVSGNMLETLKPFMTVQPPPPIKVANPMTPEQEYLRTSLRPGILATLRANERLHFEHFSLFELGKAYLARDDDLPEERRMLVGILAGDRLPRTWAAPPEPVDFFDAKGVVETLLSRLNIDAKYHAIDDPFFHPGRAAVIATDRGALGVIGEVHPRVLAAYDVSMKRVYLFELSLAQVCEAVGPIRQYRAIPRYPGVVQDVAIMVDLDVPAGEVQEVIEGHPLVRQATLFDVYQGKPLPSGKKSLAYSIVYQSAERTLTDREAGEAQERIVTQLAHRFGAVLRQ